jgi:AcrR family transcriptional regulator
MNFMAAVTQNRQEPRQRSARGEGAKLRVDLLDAAAELMATHESIEAISLRAVARRAGVSPTAVYRHFDDHLDLLAQAVDYCWTNFRDAMQRGKDSSADPFVAFHNTGLNYIEFAIRHRGQYRVIFANRLDLGLKPTTSALEAFDILVDLVAQVLEANDDDRVAFDVAIQAHTWIHGIVDLVGGNPEMPWPDTDTMLDGLGTSLRLIPAD